MALQMEGLNTQVPPQLIPKPDTGRSFLPQPRELAGDRHCGGGGQASPPHLPWSRKQCQSLARWLPVVPHRF